MILWWLRGVLCVGAVVGAARPPLEGRVGAVSQSVGCEEKEGTATQPVPLKEFHILSCASFPT